MNHCLARTSSPGEEFLGTCIYCGRINMKIEKENEECDRFSIDNRKEFSEYIAECERLNALKKY
jgi:hypothetical protein